MRLLAETNLGVWFVLPSLIISRPGDEGCPYCRTDDATAVSIAWLCFSLHVVFQDTEGQ